MNSGANAKGEYDSNMPDTAKPGEPLVYTIWSKDQKEPGFAAHVMCEYDAACTTAGDACLYACGHDPKGARI